MTVLASGQPYFPKKALSHEEIPALSCHPRLCPGSERLLLHQPQGAEVPQEYDYALSCKLKVDDPKKCEAQIRAMCDDPSKAVIRKSRHVDPKDDSVIYAYQAACNS